MRRALIPVVAIVLAFASLAITGYAGATAPNGVRTRFEIQRTTVLGGSHQIGLHGRIHAARHECVAGRQADLYFNRADKRHYRETDWSNNGGVSSLQGRWHAIPRRIVVIVRSKHVTDGSGGYTCLRTRWVWQIHGRHY
jgi:hypothetical protein